LLLNQLAVLTGDSSDNSSSLKRTSVDEIEIVKDLPQKIQSDVVLKRPDILKAEADLQKARIDVSLARKDFLPSFPITGQFGFNSNCFSKAFNWGSYTASVGSGIMQSVFTGWQKTAILKSKKYKYQEMLENYQKTILESFQEVNDSLASLKFDSEKNNNNIQRLKLEKDNMGVINNRYALGAISLLDTLRYKERVYSLEKEQTQSKTDCLVDSLSIYKATGGKL
jgi:outer membrane protein TolC